MMTVSVADCFGFKIAVFLPAQAFFALAAVATGFVQMTKLWNATPRFVTLKVTVPAGTIDVFDSLYPSSVGFPAVTLMTVTFDVAAASTAAVRVTAAGANAAWRAVSTTTDTPRTGKTIRQGGRPLIGSARLLSGQGNSITGQDFRRSDVRCGDGSTGLGDRSNRNGLPWSASTEGPATSPRGRLRRTQSATYRSRCSR